MSSETLRTIVALVAENLPHVVAVINSVFVA